MTAGAFRRSAHRRFSRDIPRGRMLLQIALVAGRDGLRDLRDELAGAAARLGVAGGTEVAFRDAYAAVAPFSEACDDRDHLTWEIAGALERGAILSSPTYTVGRLCLAVAGKGPAYAVYRDPGGVLVNAGSTTAQGAAAAFVGLRGAGVEAARAALEAWEHGQGEAPPSTTRTGWPLAAGASL